MGLNKNIVLFQEAKETEKRYGKVGRENNHKLKMDFSTSARKT